MKEFRPPNSASRARMTTVVIAVGVPIAFLLIAAISNRIAFLPGVVVLLFVIVPLAALALEGPSRMRYLVGDRALETVTMFGRARFALAGATAKRHAPGRMWRVGGTAMPGYYTGRWRESGQATRVYATTFENAVLVTTPTARVLLSPTDPDALLAALRDEGARVDG